MKRQGKRRSSQNAPVSPYMEKVIRINRVTKVNKGGKRLAFRALVIVGDKKGQVSIALGKAKEVPIAIRKAIETAKKALAPVNIIKGTVPHEIIGKFGSAKVIIKPAPPGTGVIAGGSVRILLEAVGLKNVVAKSLGSDNPVNTAKAALNGLQRMKDLKAESELRGFKLPVRFNGEDSNKSVERKTLDTKEDDRRKTIDRMQQAEEKANKEKAEKAKKKEADEEKAKQEEAASESGADETKAEETSSESTASESKEVTSEDSAAKEES
ncbi:30S ribosomal protein S5 [bacterium]|nr:30S ribosomal protein S5 [bacterium]